MSDFRATWMPRVQEAWAYLAWMVPDSRTGALRVGALYRSGRGEFVWHPNKTGFPGVVLPPLASWEEAQQYVLVMLRLEGEI